MENIEPGVTSSKTFTIKNVGNEIVESYGVYLEEVINTFTRTDDLQITLVCKEYDGNGTEVGECNGIERSYPTTNTLLVTNSIDIGYTHEYTFTFEYIYLDDVDQSEDKGKTLSGLIQVYNEPDVIDIEGTITGFSTGDYIEVQSEPKISQIASDGSYRITALGLGQHTIYLKNSSGTTIASEKIKINKDVSTNPQASIASDASSIVMQNATETAKINIGVSGNTITLEGIKIIDKNPYEDQLVSGDIVAYDAGVSTYTGKWLYLGIEEGRIKIVSAEEIGEKELSGKDGYDNGITYLNEMCEPYGNGTGGDGARSLNLEDINEITDFNPKTPLNEGKENENGNIVTYKIENGELKFYGSNGVTGGGSSSNPPVTTFTKIEDEQLLAEGEEYIITNNSYRYLATPTDNNVANILYVPITANEKYLLVGDNYTAAKQFWLANPCIITRTHSASWGLYNYAENWGGIQVERFVSLYASWLNDPNYTGFSGTHTKYVRAVVYLDLDVTLTKDSNGIWQIS